MKTRKLLPLTLSLLLAAFGLFGCMPSGTDGEGGSEEDATPTPTHGDGYQNDYIDPRYDDALLDLKFDEARGRMVSDSAGKAGEAPIHYVFNDAAYQAPREPRWISRSAASGSCLAFDGYSSYIDYPKERFTASGRGLTVDVFVAPRAFEWDDPNAVELGSEKLMVIAGQYDAARNAGFVLGMHKYGEWSFQLGLGDRWVKVWNDWDGALLERYVWNHLTAVFDGEAGMAYLYRNGRLIREQEVGEGAIAQAASPLVIGRSAEREGGVFEKHMFNGLMDELRIYGAALSAAEVAAYHESYLAGGKLREVVFEDAWLDESVLDGDVYKPQYHAAPPQHWMNEPHALFVYRGRYHMFYQFNLTGPYWAQICWGHWVSDDLVHWRNVREAIVPAKGTVAPDGVWTGNMAYDAKGEPVLFFTAGNDTRPNGSNQNIAIARPKDPTDPDLTEWVVSEKLAVQQKAGMGVLGEFRDPQVFYEDGCWYMVVGGRRTDGKGTAHVFTTRDDSFTDWQYRGELFTPEPYLPSYGMTWEMPNLTPITNADGTIKKYLFVMSPTGGAADNDVHYFLGDFDKETCRFTPEQSLAQFMDYGNNVFTGPTVFREPDTGRVLICSIIQDQRGAREQYDAGWAHTAGIPRKLSLDDAGRLKVEPIAELDGLCGETLAAGRDVTVEEANAALAKVGGDMLAIRLRLKAGSGGAFGLQLKKDAAHETLLEYAPETGEIAVDTTRSGNKRVAGRFGGKLELSGGVLELTVYIDRALVECYANGSKTLTAMVYQTADGLTLYGDVERVLSFEVRRMESI